MQEQSIQDGRGADDESIMGVGHAAGDSFSLIRFFTSLAPLLFCCFASFKLGGRRCCWYATRGGASRSAERPRRAFQRPPADCALGEEQCRAAFLWSFLRRWCPVVVLPTPFSLFPSIAPSIPLCPTLQVSSWSDQEEVDAGQALFCSCFSGGGKCVESSGRVSNATRAVKGECSILLRQALYSDTVGHRHLLFPVGPKRSLVAAYSPFPYPPACVCFFFQQKHFSCSPCMNHVETHIHTRRHIEQQ